MARFRKIMRRLCAQVRKAQTAILMLAIVLTATGCATHGIEGMKTGEETPFKIDTFSFDRHEAPYDVLPEYRISAGDILDVLFQIRTWEKKSDFVLSIDNVIAIKFVHAPELNSEEKVRPDGTITLPYIGKISVIGRNLDQLTKQLRDYYDTILQNSELLVTMVEYRSAIKELKADLHTAPRGLSRLVTVRPDGNATFPMVGDLIVAGRTFKEVVKELNEKYENVMSGLHADLFLEKHTGSKLYVLGQVGRPGVYDIGKPVTVEQALAMAGSFLPGAQLNDIIVVRKNKDQMVATRIDMKNSFNTNNEYKFFYLIPDDIVYVPKRPITKAAELTREIADVLFFRGWSMGFSWTLHDPTVRGARWSVE